MALLAEARAAHDIILGGVVTRFGGGAVTTGATTTGVGLDVTTTVSGVGVRACTGMGSGSKVDAGSHSEGALATNSLLLAGMYSSSCTRVDSQFDLRSPTPRNSETGPFAFL